ncbi:MAG: hypothetical protein VR70_10965 [Rhodospirillaceae bacterium BRH_c57]|nr:MAG: hypothetical protein VR70_10965 [Rhodospirillaceae bacterium BRH_c57]
MEGFIKHIEAFVGGVEESGHIFVLDARSCYGTEVAGWIAPLSRLPLFSLLIVGDEDIHVRMAAAISVQGGMAYGILQADDGDSTGASLEAALECARSGKPTTLVSAPSETSSYRIISEACDGLPVQWLDAGRIGGAA